MEWLAMIVSAVFAAGGAYAAVKVELRWLRRDVDRNAEAIRHAHRRIDDLRRAA